MKTAIYLRVSTEEQADNYSIPSQKERLEAFAKSQDWSIVAEYVDDGYSGKNLDRPGMQKLLKDAKQQRFDVVAVYRLDRFSRRAVDLLRTVEETFEPNKVYLKSATEPFDTSTIAGRMMLTMLVGFAQFERESIGERVKVNMLHKAKGGEWCGAYMAPFGYYHQDKKLYINETEAAIVREMFAMYDSGSGFRSIALALNEKGSTTRQGKQWIHTRIRNIIINPVYAGVSVWNRTERKGTKTIHRAKEEWVIVEGEHDPIVDKPLFDRVQARMHSKSPASPRDTSEYILSGLIWCGKCGSKYRGWMKKAKKEGRIVRYYRCGGYSDGIHCNGSNIQTEKLEAAVLDELEKLEFNEEGQLNAILAADTRRAQDEIILAGELGQARTELSRMDSRKNLIFDAYEKGAIGIQDLQVRMERLNNEKDALERRLMGLETRQINIQLNAADVQRKLDGLKDIRSRWDNAAVVERKLLARTMISRIVILGSETIDLHVFD